MSWVLIVCILFTWSLLISSIVFHKTLILIHPPITIRPDAYTPKLGIDNDSQAVQRCPLYLNRGHWSTWPLRVEGPCDADIPFASCTHHWERKWTWSRKALACGGHYFNQTSAKTLLTDKNLYFVGDSIARLLMMGVMRTAGWRGNVLTYGRHADVEVEIPTGKHSSVNLNFVWRPFPENVTEFLSLGLPAVKHADMILVSTSLWHMLHIADAHNYQEQMALLQSSLSKSPMPVRCPVLSTVSEVFEQRLPLHKRATMTSATVDAYNKALDSSTVYKTFSPLDMFSLTYGCGLECNIDGVHSRKEVYDAASQILLNILSHCAGA